MSSGRDRRRKFRTLGGSNALTLMKSAAHWYSSKDPVVSGVRVNRGTNGDTMQQGSTTGTDTNDFLHLPHTGEDYVWLPGTDDNAIETTVGVATPSASSFTFSFDGVIEGSSASEGLISQYLTDGNNRAFTFRYNPAQDDFDVFLSANGSSVGSGGSVTAASQGVTVPGTRVVITGTVTLSGSGASVVIVVNGVTFPAISLPSFTATQVYQTTIPVLVGARFDSASALGTGAREVMKGRVYGASIGGTTFEASDLTGWTVNRSATGLKTAVVTRPVDLYDDVDDYGQLPASATPSVSPQAGQAAFLVVVRRHNITTFDQLVHWSSGTTANVLALHFNNSQVRAELRSNSGTFFQAPGAGFATAGALTVAGGVLDNGTLYGYLDGTGFGTGVDVSGADAFSSPLSVGRVGSRSDAVSQILGDETYEVLVFPGKGKSWADENFPKIAAKIKAGTYS